MRPPPPAENAPKDAWRAWAKTVRASAVTDATNRRVAAALRAWEPYRRARRVLAYLAFGSEVDLGPLLRDPAKTFFVTRTSAAPGAPLTIHRLEPDELVRHRFGYRQPPAGAAPVDPAEVELALVPGLCFDRHGTRLGYGKGYFDRLLPLLPPGAPRVGVSIEALVVPALPREAFDVPMTHLATEVGVRPVEAGE